MFLSFKRWTDLARRGLQVKNPSFVCASVNADVNCSHHHKMTFHDAHITCFLQLWRRSIRSGHAFAEGFWNYGYTQERYCMKQVLSILFWSFILPLTILTTFIPSRGFSLMAFLFYLIPHSRIVSFQQKKGYSKPQSRLYAKFILVLKFAEFFGILIFLYRRLFGRKQTLIEYKSL